jgi:hypothetical protein
MTFSFRLAASSARMCAAWCALTCGLCLPGSLWSQNTFPASGNVGIGTGSPAFALSVQGINSFAGAIISLNSYDDTHLAAFGLSRGGTTDGYWATAGGPHAFADFVTTKGDIVLMGYTHDIILSARNATGSIRFGTGAADTEKMTIASSGSVGIGTTNTGQCGGSNTFPCLLTVNGAIGVKEIIVTTGITADYVFQPDYRLKPLTEVASFIREHHHLPEIPSEAEVKLNGLSVGDMQVKLLAKVEELTLHMIQADERNNRLDRQNRELRERLARLEARDPKTEAPAGKVAGEK